MATLKIRAEKSLFPASAPPAFLCFRDAAGKPFAAYPGVEDGEVLWEVPDTPHNRALIESDFKPSGLYSCESANLEAPKPLCFARKEKDKPKPQGKGK